MSKVAFEFGDLVGLLVVLLANGARLQFFQVIVHFCPELLYGQRSDGGGIRDVFENAFPHA